MNAEAANNLAAISVGAPLLLLVIAFFVAGTLKAIELITKKGLINATRFCRRRG